MKACLTKIFVIAVALLVGCLVFTANSEAQTSPYFTYTGTFGYDAGTNALSVSVSTIGLLRNIDGGFSFSYMQDPIVGGHFVLGNLYNGDNTGSGENWIFGPTPGGTSGLVSFILYDYYGNQRLTADVSNFTVSQNGSSIEMNTSFNMYNVSHISTDTNTPASEFISDVNSYNPVGGNLSMVFNFGGGGATDFTETNSGSISGTFAVAPEPVSAILFVSGGAVLAFRRFNKRRVNQVS